MPVLFTYSQYVVFFWVGENGEPVHVHVAVKHATPNATKFWLTKNTGCVLANNNGRIPKQDVRELTKLITLNHARICQKWVEAFGEDSLRFYE